MLVVVELGVSANDIADGYFLRSFFYVWIGYPAVFAISVLVRNCRGDEKDGTAQTVPEYVSLFKDVVYGLLDIWSKAVLVVWSTYGCFGQPFLDTAPARPHFWVHQ